MTCPIPPRSATAMVVALAAAFVCGPSVRVTSAAVQEPAPASIAIESRSLQPGELVVVNASLPEGATGVQIIGLGQTVNAYPLDGTRWQALLGIDLEVVVGEHRIRLEGWKGSDPVGAETTIDVRPKAFATRTLKVPPEFVNPPRAVRARIAREAALLAEILGESASERLWSGPFVRPVPHRANSRFGTRSVFNGEPRNPHSGTDFLSPAGTPVRAPAAGRVVLAQPLYFSGLTVIIDHGLGMFSQLLHLSRIDVASGDTITAGTIVGLVGATGRVTGAHLHWSLRVGGARVDPMAALELLGDTASP